MSVLITSYANDFHAAIIEWCLKEYTDTPVTFLSLSDVPSLQLSACVESPGELRVRQVDGSFIAVQSPSVVWRRRWPKVSTNENVHPSDAEFVRRENTRFVDAALRHIGRGAIWVNDHDAALAADQKLLQLHAARDCGLRVPRTLVSNDPQMVREWVSEEREAIYKSFFPVTWKTPDGRIRSNFTAKVTTDLLKSDDSISACGGIYQEEIHKDYELRVTIFGDYCITARIDSQKHESTTTDWRIGFCGELHLQSFDLPDEVRLKCFELMKRLGLRFACIDLAVTLSGDYVFFELNEMGQFLWIEEYSSELTLLDKFVHYLCQLSGNDRPKKKVQLSEVRYDDSFQKFYEDRCSMGVKYDPGLFVLEEATDERAS